MKKDKHAGASSEGFSSTVFPAEIAPINGSNARAASRTRYENKAFDQLRLGLEIFGFELREASIF